MNWNKNISFVKILALLVCVLGVGSALAKWDGKPSATAPSITKIDGKDYYMIANEGDLAWFSDTVNNYVLGEKWNAMVSAINADITNETYKTYKYKPDGASDSIFFSDSLEYITFVLALMTEIRKDPDAYDTIPEKRALWNKSPYKGYLDKARSKGGVKVLMNAIVTADYLDMAGIPFIPIAAGQGAGSFGGIFDGNRVTIKNLVVDANHFKKQFYDVLNSYPTYCQNAGLFGIISGTVKNIILDNVLIQGVGKSEFHVNWLISNQVSIGAFAGYMEGGNIETCFASGKVTSYGTDVGAGGIVGSMKNGKVINTLSNVSIDVSGADVYAGGISGVARGNSLISSCVYDGDALFSHPDEEGAQGGLAGHIFGTLTVERSFYASDVVPEGSYGRIEVDMGGAVKDDGMTHGVTDLNVSEKACILNKGTWNGSSCENPTSDIWSNSDNITNIGVSKDAQGNAVYLITFDANKGSFAAGDKTTKMLRFGDALTAAEIGKPTRDNFAHGGWALTADATAPASSLGTVYKATKIYAFWKDLYTVTFNANGSQFLDNSTSKTKKVAEGESITDEDIDAPRDYSKGTGENRKDYKFIGWALTKNAAEPAENLGIASGNKTVYAVWKETQAVFHSVVFNSQGHETVKRVEHNFTVEAPTVSAVRGYTFDGWFKESTFENPFDFSTPITEDVTAYAKWTLQTYTITYNVNGGVNDPANLGSYTIESPTLILKDPTKEGYDFLGWYYDDSYVDRATQVGDTIGNISLFAKWSVKTYTISYSAGGTLIKADGDLISIEKIHGQDMVLLGKGLFKAAGYEQDGWTIVDGNESAPKTFELDAPYTKNESVYLFPHWKKADYKITFHNVDNALNFAPIKTTYQRDTISGHPITDWTANPQMDGFKFDGWFKNADYSGNKVTSIAKGEFGDLDLYAKWTQVTVTVTVNGQTREYDGNSLGAKASVSWTSGYDKNPYTVKVVTDSIKDVGKILAKMRNIVITRTETGLDVTSKFIIAPPIESGDVEVTKRPITFSGMAESKTYTGNVFTVSGDASVTSPKKLATNHTHTATYYASESEAGEYEETMNNVKIYDAAGNEVTQNYDITLDPKKLTINPTNEIFTVDFSDEYVYGDGVQSHSMSIGATSNALSGTTSFVYQYGNGSGSIWEDFDDLGEQSAIGNHQVTVKATNPNYKNSVTKTAYLIIQNKPVITIRAKSAEKVYDGAPLTAGWEQVGLEEGDELTVMIDGSITNVGSDVNDVVSYNVSGVNSNSHYNFNIVKGVLKVNPATLTISTASDSKTYDGTQLTATANISGLVNLETATITATGSQTVVGSSNNTYSISWGTAKPSNYTITEDLGTLTVTPKTVSIAAAEASKLYGEADPSFTGSVEGLVPGDDLGVTYYRTNPSEKNAGVYDGVIVASYTANPNYAVTVTPAKFTIHKRNVTLTSATDSKTYDGTALTAPTVTVGGDGFVPNEGVLFTVSGLQKDAGSSENAFTYKLKDGTDISNYDISVTLGSLTVNKATATVKVKGHSNSYVYNGTEQKVFGYDLTIDNPLYTLDDFSFDKTETADSIVTGTNVKVYKMGLVSGMFKNDNSNFDVTFIVEEDGALTITPKSIEVTVGNTSKIYGYPISDSDYKAVTYATGFSENDPIDDLLKKCTYSRTPAGNKVGTYTVSAVCPDDGNYKVTNVPNTDNFKITKRTLVLKATAEKIYGDNDPATCSAVISGFATGDTAMVSDCKFESRVTTGENIGDYFFMASVSADEVEWKKADKENYTVSTGSGILTINRKDVTVKVADATIVYGADDPKYSYVFSGLVKGDSENLIKIDSTRRDEGDYPDSYKVHAYGAAVQGNYNVSFVDGTLNIVAENTVKAWWHVDAKGNLKESIEVPIKVGVKNDGEVKNAIRSAITARNITPVRDEDADSIYVYNKNWSKLETAKYVAGFKSQVKRTEIIVKYDDGKKDTIHTAIDNPRIRVDSLLTPDINSALTNRNIDLPTKPEDEDSTYVIASWKKNSDGMYEPVFKGVAKTKLIIVKYSENDDDLVGVNISLVALRDETLRNQAINDCMDSLQIVPSHSGNYEFTGKWKQLADDEYEAIFVKFDPLKDMKTVVAKYGDRAKDTVIVHVYKNATEASIIKTFTDTLSARNIKPTKADDGEYGYTFDGSWSLNTKTKQYEPGFIKSKIVRIVVKYGDSEKDTVHMTINESDTDSIVEQKIEDFLKAEAEMPTREGDSTHVFVFKKFVLNESTNMYEPVFVKKDRVFNVDFHLPSAGRLASKFNGYIYGKVTMLPEAYIKGDAGWEFKGWYEKPNGLGERYKAILSTEYGDKDVYPLFQKRIPYVDSTGKKGEIVVVYSEKANRDIARAYESLTRLMAQKSAPRFSVAVNGRSLEISGARVGAKISVFDLNGVVVSQGIIANGTQRVELAKPGNYIVRVNNQVQRVNVK